MQYTCSRVNKICQMKTWHLKPSSSVTGLNHVQVYSTCINIGKGHILHCTAWIWEFDLYGLRLLDTKTY
jgi:hypothetical protein